MLALMIGVGTICVCVGGRWGLRARRRRRARLRRARAYRIAMPGELDDDGLDDALPPGVACAIRASSAAAASTYAGAVPTRYLVDAKQRAQVGPAGAPGVLPPGMLSVGNVLGGILSGRASPTRTRSARAERSSPVKSSPGKLHRVPL
jgi:hypothetical protein